MTKYIIIASFAIGIGLGWYLHRPAKTVSVPQQIQAPQEILPGGQVKLEKRPARVEKGKVPIEAGKPTLKPGETVDHVVDTVVEPTKPGNITVHLVFIKEPGGQGRVIATAENGNVLTGIDVPVEYVTVKPDSALPPGQKRSQYSVIGLWGEGHKYGAEFQWTPGPFVVGVGHIAGTTFVAAGVRF